MIRGKQKLRLLPKRALVKTGDVDHADWNFRPLLGTISRTRFRLVLALMGEERFERLLEIGYGSAVFMPELAAHARELYGIDIHEKHGVVTERLAGFGVSANLFSGSMTGMPFEDNFFDCAVGVSSFEFVEDVDAACLEVKRVLKPEGFLIVVTPGHSAITDMGLKLLTGKSAKQDFEHRREKLMDTLLRHFSTERELVAPRMGSSVVRLYTGLKLRPLGRV